MLFNSAIFVLGFLPITLTGFFLLGANGFRRLAIAWLVVASAVYYGWFKWEYLILLGVLVVFNYWAGVQLARDHRRGRKRRLFLICSLAVNLAVLGYFKYMNFFVHNVDAAFGAHYGIRHIVLPLGISFFTFQKIAYLVDAYRGEAEEYDFLEFCLFVMYFPQLIAGPIVHHKEMIPQFRQAKIFRLCPTDLAAGLLLFTLGLVKKVVIADQVAVWADAVFGNVAAAPSLIESWCATLAFTFQIYFDFSGYTDMALGMALMIGIRLPLNFNSPYKATSIIEFWRHWHMTLSRFLRDYVYIPLGGNRKGPSRRYAYLMITMLIGGLWHGAAWTFVVWGGLHGCYLIVNHGWRGLRQRYFPAARSGLWSRWIGRGVTFLAVVVAWVFFRAQGFHTAAAVLRGMAGMNGLGFSFTASDLATAEPLLVEGCWLLVILVGVWTLPNSQQLLARYRPSLASLDEPKIRGAPTHIACRLGILGPDSEIALTGLTGAIIAVAVSGSLITQAMRDTVLHPFIYFQF